MRYRKPEHIAGKLGLHRGFVEVVAQMCYHFYHPGFPPGYLPAILYVYKCRVSSIDS